MQTTAAATAAMTWIALYAGHQLGDHPFQRDADARAKACPAPESGRHPWSGWGHCAYHVATYTATQAVALALISVVAPLTWYGSGAALAVSAFTHAVIDRRWIVAWVIERKGGCPDWPAAGYTIDQALHLAALGVACIVAAVVVTPVAAGAVLLAGVAMVVGALAIERFRASRWATAAAGASPQHHLSGTTGSP